LVTKDAAVLERRAGATAFIPSDCNRWFCRRRNAYRKNTDTTENASTLRR